MVNSAAAGHPVFRDVNIPATTEISSAGNRQRERGRIIKWDLVARRRSTFRSTRTVLVC